MAIVIINSDKANVSFIFYIFAFRKMRVSKRCKGN